MKFLFTCGGTAGHVNPALAIAGRLAELMPESEFLFVGAEGHMECELIPREGYELKTVEISNIMRGISLEMVKHNVHTLKTLRGSIKAARGIIEEFKPDVAIGTGGYVCYPVLAAAAKLGIPTAMHESNAIPGLTTKMLEGRVDRIMLGINSDKGAYKHPEKVVFTGTPARGGFKSGDTRELRRELGLDPDKPYVVSVWGSLGADHINDIMAGFIARLAQSEKFNLVHSTGKRGGYQTLTSKLRAIGVDDWESKGCDIREYIYNMPQVMAACDIVMCRAGGSTLSELAALGKPAILVPSPNVANNHQEKNARAVEAKGGAKVILDSECGADDLYDAVCALLDSPDTLSEMAENMRKTGTSDPAAAIVDIILALAEK